MKNLIAITTLLFFACLPYAQAQFGIGLTTGGDFYQRYANPENPADSGALRSSGNVFLNSAIGPKIWIGKRRFSVSIEAQVVYGATSIGIREYKGMGTIAFPMMMHLNFNGLSGFSNNNFGTGFSIGGGVQYSKTELYGTTRDYENLDRNLFPTYVGEVKLGFGGKGIMVDLFLRYGLGLDSDRKLSGANSLNIGLSSSFNLTQIKKNGKKKSKNQSKDAQPQIQQ
ncbi:MAG: hypothetical protein ACPGXZ_16560, partial [Saprospiraceae bacterium]